MTPSLVRGLSLFAAGLLCACASTQGGAGTDRNVIYGDEIAPIQALVSTAFDVVLRLRSEFLRGRGPTSATRRSATEAPVYSVFRDGVELGTGSDALRIIPATELLEIRYYTPAMATTKFGSRHTGGVIEVKTTRSGRAGRP